MKRILLLVLSLFILFSNFGCKKIYKGVKETELGLLYNNVHYIKYDCRGYYKHPDSKLEVVGSIKYLYITHYYYFSHLDKEQNILFSRRAIYLKEGFSLPDEYNTKINSITLKDSNESIQVDLNDFILNEIIENSVLLTDINKQSKEKYLDICLKGYDYLMLRVTMYIDNANVYIAVNKQLGEDLYYKIKENYVKLFIV